MNLQGKLYIKKLRGKSIIPEVEIDLNKVAEIGQKKLEILKKMHGKQIKIKIISVIEKRERKVKK